jgi:hypothetical protein
MYRPTLRAAGTAICVTAVALSAAVTVSAQRARPEAQMADSARAFLATLDPAQRAKASIPFNSEERLNWHYVPKTGERKGLQLKDMNPAQQKAALSLLATGLSQRGYDKASTIRHLDLVLREMEKNPRVRDPEFYFFSVFGEPSDNGTWGWRYEGHHSSLNWTLVKGKVAGSTPQFFGANPGEVRIDVPGAPPKGTRVLGKEEDLGRALVKSLNAEQKSAAVIDPKAPADILTAASRVAAIQEDKGLPYSKLSKEQQGMLLSIVQEYADVQPKPIAQERIAKLRKAGLDNVKFAWMGGLELGEPHYYRIQGSTFLIEYDNTQNNANHPHSVWRDFKGDWGMDLLAMHYQTSPHRIAAAK